MAVYMVAEIKLRNGMMGEYEAAMPAMLEAFEPHGWKLTASYQVIYGDINEIFHTWVAEDANATVAALEAAGAQEDFGKLFVAMRDYTEYEHISLCRKSPYSP